MSDNPFTQQPDSPSENPYAPTSQTSTAVPGEVDPNDFEAYRQHHLSHEANVKSIGCLYYLGAALGLLLGITYLGLGLSNGDPDFPAGFMVGIGAVMLIMAVVQGFVGYGIRGLKPWARIAGIVLSVIGLMGIPVGTIISIFFLYLLISRKGEIVFSEYYQYVISQTPHIVYKTSIIVKVFLVLLIVVISLAAVAIVFGG